MDSPNQPGSSRTSLQDVLIALAWAVGAGFGSVRGGLVSYSGALMCGFLIARSPGTTPANTALRRLGQPGPMGRPAWRPVERPVGQHCVDVRRTMPIRRRDVECDVARPDRPRGAMEGQRDHATVGSTIRASSAANASGAVTCGEWLASISKYRQEGSFRARSAKRPNGSAGAVRVQ